MSPLYVLLKMKAVVLIVPPVYWAVAFVDFLNLECLHRGSISASKSNVRDFVAPIPYLLSPAVGHRSVFDRFPTAYRFVIPMERENQMQNKASLTTADSGGVEGQFRLYFRCHRCEDSALVKSNFVSRTPSKKNEVDCVSCSASVCPYLIFSFVFYAEGFYTESYTVQSCRNKKSTNQTD